MPELPEVQAVVERLARTLPGRRIVAARIYRARLVAPENPARFVRRLRGARVERVTRRAKFILLELDHGRTLLTHLRMTGHLFVAPAGVRREFSTNNFRPVRAAFALDNGLRLVLEDPRGLAVMRLLPRAQALEQMQELGVEPLSPAFTPAALFRITRGRRSPLKLFLLDQRRIAGLGNIYAAEALWRARLDPRKSAGRLTRREATRLHRAIVDVLREAMAGARRGYHQPSRLSRLRVDNDRGAVLQDCAGPPGPALAGRGRPARAWTPAPHGIAGVVKVYPGQDTSRVRPEEEFQPAVYGSEGEHCPRCARPICRIVQGARSTFFCPRCQK